MKRLRSSGLLVILCLVVVPVMAYATGWFSVDSFASAVCAGAALGAMRLFLAPLLKFISKPLGCATLGLAYFAIDVLLIYLAEFVLGGFDITSILGPVVTAAIINALSAVLIKAR